MIRVRARVVIGFGPGWLGFGWPSGDKARGRVARVRTRVLRVRAQVVKGRVRVRARVAVA